ncbi:heparan-alpha-glucosaminide N-acetyltransferase domain-containing protein [Apibacter raozihei]|uniref:DUF1624 domain-containing protein n=1 Tax=Apibacter raozihei TaxID=2500547 RepID=UPI000FE2EB41|nr:heparan-alpha-glucosaminide N-acetyltransferase domain-containing protein [Apibacter raozihei]
MEKVILRKRITSIDMLRGLVMLFMLLDHVRETFFLHLQMGDPVDVQTVSFPLFFNRMLAHICAPVFILLTGLSAFLYGQARGGSRKEISLFLFKRGVFLILLELIVINFGWTGEFPPHKIYLQVIWAIGFSMISLSLLLWLPEKLLLILALILIFGHNTLDSLHFDKSSPWYTPWAILHDRSWLNWGWINIRTSYPILPWIGVISLGYCLGPLFKKTTKPVFRQRFLLISGFISLSLFLILRYINVYGDKPWMNFDSSWLTFMSFFNITKYPPSLLFLLFTLSIAFFLLFGFEKLSSKLEFKPLLVLGSVPMFFYIVHLYFLKLLYLLCVAVWGKNKGDFFGFTHVWQLWTTTIVIAFILYPFVKWFSKYKSEHKNIEWLKYL